MVTFKSLREIEIVHKATLNAVLNSISNVEDKTLNKLIVINKFMQNEEDRVRTKYFNLIGPLIMLDNLSQEN